MFVLRVLLSVVLGVLALSTITSASALGQATDNGQAEPTPTAEMMGEDRDADAEAIAADVTPTPVVPVAEPVIGLELGTYERGWTRFLNSGPDGELFLEVDGVTRFPWIPVNNGHTAIEVEDFEDADFAANLVIERQLIHDEELVAGVCDTEILKQYFTTDILCTPGPGIMQPALIFLVLFHPETYEAVAVTTTIDNRGGGAAQLRQPTSTPAPAAEPVSDAERRCGPFAPGQWIKPADYAASGVTLPVNTSGVFGDITDYQCMVPETGSPYLQAYSIREQDGGGDGGDGGDDDDDGGDNVDDVNN